MLTRVHFSLPGAQMSCQRGCRATGNELQVCIEVAQSKYLLGGCMLTVGSSSSFCKFQFSVMTCFQSANRSGKRYALGNSQQRCLHMRSRHHFSRKCLGKLTARTVLLTRQAGLDCIPFWNVSTVIHEGCHDNQHPKVDWQSFQYHPCLQHLFGLKHSYNSQ